MKFRIILWLVLSMTMIGAVLLAGSQPVQAQSETACINCHETQAKNPVRTEGDWHIQHNTLACELCHAGNPAGETQEAAHTGLITEPLAAGTACMMCHPEFQRGKDRHLPGACRMPPPPQRQEPQAEGMSCAR